MENVADISHSQSNLLRSTGACGADTAHTVHAPEEDFQFCGYVDDLCHAISNFTFIMHPTNVDRQAHLWAIESEGKNLLKIQVHLLDLEWGEYIKNPCPFAFGVVQDLVVDSNSKEMSFVVDFEDSTN